MPASDVVFESLSVHDAGGREVVSGKPSRWARWRSWAGVAAVATLLAGGVVLARRGSAATVLYLPAGSDVQLVDVRRRAQDTTATPWTTHRLVWWTTSSPRVAISVSWSDQRDPSYAASGGAADVIVHPAQVVGQQASTWVSPTGARSVAVVTDRRSLQVLAPLPLDALTTVAAAVLVNPAPVPPVGYVAGQPVVSVGAEALSVTARSKAGEFSYLVFPFGVDVLAAHREAIDRGTPTAVIGRVGGRPALVSNDGSSVVWSPRGGVTVWLRAAGQPAVDALTYATVLAWTDEVTFDRRVRSAGLNPEPETWQLVGTGQAPDGATWTLAEVRRGDDQPCLVLARSASDGRSVSADPCQPGRGARVESISAEVAGQDESSLPGIDLVAPSGRRYRVAFGTVVGA